MGPDINDSFGFYQIVGVVLHCGEAQRNGWDVHLICFGFPTEHCVRFHTVSAHLHWQGCQVMRDLLEGYLGFRLVECLRGFEVRVKVSVFLVVPLLIQIFVNVTNIAIRKNKSLHAIDNQTIPGCLRKQLVILP